MNVRAGATAGAGHRSAVLRELGYTPWVRRLSAGSAAPAVDGMEAGAPLPSTDDTRCVLVLPEHCSPAALDLLGRALHAGGPALARAGRVRVHAGKLTPLPMATSYLVFGAAQAEILRQCLPVAASAHATTIVVDDLATLLGDGGAKRRLWAALRGLCARLSAGGG